MTKYSKPLRFSTSGSRSSELEVMYNGEFGMFAWKQESKIIVALFLCFPPSEFCFSINSPGKVERQRLLSALMTSSLWAWPLTVLLQVFWRTSGLAENLSLTWHWADHWNLKSTFPPEDPCVHQLHRQMCIQGTYFQVRVGLSEAVVCGSCFMSSGIPSSWGSRLTSLTEWVCAGRMLYNKGYAGKTGKRPRINLIF